MWSSYCINCFKTTTHINGASVSMIMYTKLIYNLMAQTCFHPCHVLYRLSIHDTDSITASLKCYSYLKHNLYCLHWFPSVTEFFCQHVCVLIVEQYHKINNSYGVHVHPVKLIGNKVAYVHDYNQVSIIINAEIELDLSKCYNV